MILEGYRTQNQDTKIRGWADGSAVKGTPALTRGLGSRFSSKQPYGWS